MGIQKNPQETPGIARACPDRVPAELVSDMTLLGPGQESHPAYSAFVEAMHGKAYGREALRSAWAWFATGWTCSAAAAKVKRAARAVGSSMSRVEELRLTKQAMLSILESQQSRRSEYRGTEWLAVEIDVMHHAINCERSKRGLPDLPRERVVRVERMAAGHSDYASKFALYCAELALPEVAR